MYLNWIDEIDPANGNYLLLVSHKDRGIGIHSQHDTGEDALTVATTVEENTSIVKLVSVEFCREEV